jgi:ECF transporter S component (folate family)
MADMKNSRFILINISYIGALIALQIVLGNLVQIPTPIKQLNFGFLPIAMGGYLFGPFGGMLVAALGDFIGTLLFGTGAYHPGFTITAALVGIAYGWFLSPKYHQWLSNCCKSRIGGLFIRALLAVIAGAVIYDLLNSYWLISIIGKGYTAILISRQLFHLIDIPVYTAVIATCCFQMKRLPPMLLPDEIRRNIIEKP